MIASLSRAVTEGLTAQQSAEQFEASPESIYQASRT
jgi:fructose-bisphosphate aldolase class 1